ncbi:UDP-N-acetylmuramate dehydrogenase [Candidatus Sumerlaeota bacterium]|nr:UDP-N-acetylmuramate dehydrogenase [Candidatus Sumerlaeota bacterium]
MMKANIHIKRMKGVRYLMNQALSSYTSMQVGGRTAMILQPEDMDALVRLTTYLHEKNVPFYILGGGTNTIFGEDGFPGVVIRLGRGFRFLERLDRNRLHAGAAGFLPLLLEQSMKWNLSGLEFCYGIPGTVGGAVAGNAGMDGLGIHDFITVIHGVTLTGNPVTLRKGDYSYRYRYVEWPKFCLDSTGKVLQKVKDESLIVTSVVFQMQEANPEEQNQLLEKYKIMRSRQPAQRGTAGSIFKNPAGDYAGRLIEAAGLKGRAIGDALVSPAHGNWIINKGRASAQDVLTLISLVQNTVFRRFGVKLEPEVKIVGAP